ncbi:hypothetical protein KIW84_041168 [Lathyrus oleraceus]|uniref:Uncharacterized protein n=1 Tax=Pisum sativum TaxID=3888 RepID=A0A9D5AQT3_PEA|nr:hypothetical protein KIW84_041168 [Pisum sativum]
MWPTVDIEEMLPSKYKKGPSRHTKLRFREHDVTCSRMMMPGLTCRCTKCDKFGNNSRKFQSNEHDPNALKRKVAYHKLAILHYSLLTMCYKLMVPYVMEKNIKNQEKTPTASTEGVDTANANEGVDEPEIDAIIEDMLASFDGQPFQVQHSQIYNPTHVPVEDIMEAINNVGPGSSMYAPSEPDDTIDDSQGPSKEDPKSGTCLPNMKSCDDISRKTSQ